MTESADDPSPEPDDIDSLGLLKDVDDVADDTPVEDASGARARWNWNPVTDAGGNPRVEGESATSRSGFQFDLGGALARLGDDEPAGHSTEPQPTARLDRHDAEPVVAPAPVFDPAPVAPPAAVFDPDPVAPPASRPGHRPTFEYTPVVAQPQIETTVPAMPDTSPVLDERVQTEPISGFADEPLPRRARSGSPVETASPVAPAQIPDLESTAAPVLAAQPVDQPLPTRSSSRGSVFEANAPAPVLPPRPTFTPTPTNPTDPGRLADRIGSDRLPMTGALPTLPAANPVAPPPIIAPIESAPSTPDLNALRSAQMRASRQQQRGKMFGRSLLAFLVIAALIAAALTYGRSYLFPTEWDATLTPIVDVIQETTGIEFDHTIPLVVQSPDEYASALLASTLGNDWAASVPEWRALGLANGDVTAATVAARLSERTGAFYDPVADTIFQAEGRPDEQVGPALQTALLEAFQHQLQAPVENVVETSSFGLTGVSSPQSLTRRAVDAYLIRRTAGEAFAPQPAAATDTLLPIPIAYQLAAVDSLGESILTAAGVDPAALQPGAAYPAAIYGAIGDSPVNSSAPLLQVGDQPTADAIALGLDDWSLVWGSRLPSTSIERLSRIIVSDTYRPINRGGASCFVAVFQTDTEFNGTVLFSSMQLWAQRAPAGSQALATLIDPTRVQLEACDPGAAIMITTDPASVDALIERQIARLTG